MFQLEQQAIVQIVWSLFISPFTTLYCEHYCLFIVCRWCFIVTIFVCFHSGPKNFVHPARRAGKYLQWNSISICVRPPEPTQCIFSFQTWLPFDGSTKKMVMCLVVVVSFVIPGVIYCQCWCILIIKTSSTQYSTGYG